MGIVLELGYRDCRNYLLQVRILRTEANTVPCLGRLDIRGRVCGEGERARRLRRGLQQLRERRGDTGTYTRQQGPAFFGGQDEEDDVEIVEADGSDHHPSGRLSAAVEKDGDDETPAEFLDAITHSLMLLPMTLPSGHTVDRSTVDR